MPKRLASKNPNDPDSPHFDILTLSLQMKPLLLPMQSLMADCEPSFLTVPVLRSSMRPLAWLSVVLSCSRTAHNTRGTHHHVNHQLVKLQLIMKYRYWY